MDLLTKRWKTRHPSKDLMIPISFSWRWSVSVIKMPAGVASSLWADIKVVRENIISFVRVLTSYQQHKIALLRIIHLFETHLFGPQENAQMGSCSTLAYHSLAYHKLIHLASNYFWMMRYSNASICSNIYIYSMTLAYLICFMLFTFLQETPLWNKIR